MPLRKLNIADIYPEQNLAFVEGLGADVPLDRLTASQWTEDRRPVGRKPPGKP